VASPTLATPYSDQISLGYSWQANPWLGLNVDASHIKYRDLPYRFRGNPFDPTTGKRRFPNFGNFRIWYGNGFADYNGVNIGGHARLGDKFGADGAFTNTTTPCDGYAFDLSPGVNHVNTLRGDSFSQTDVRVAKELKIHGNYGIELIGEVFNLFNSKNATGFRGNREVL